MAIARGPIPHSCRHHFPRSAPASTACSLRPAALQPGSSIASASTDAVQARQEEQQRPRSAPSATSGMKLARNRGGRCMKAKDVLCATCRLQDAKPHTSTHARHRQTSGRMPHAPQRAAAGAAAGASASHSPSSHQHVALSHWGNSITKNNVGKEKQQFFWYFLRSGGERQAGSAVHGRR